jgi:hypothetical protein
MVMMSTEYSKSLPPLVETHRCKIFGRKKSNTQHAGCISASESESMGMREPEESQEDGSRWKFFRGFSLLHFAFLWYLQRSELSRHT